MLSLESAKHLAAAGIMWDPRPGDRFVIDNEQLHQDAFWISDLTVEVHHYQDQTVLGFNGTTEWALDSVDLDQSIWLPREDQLRELIGDRLNALLRTPDGWEVRVSGAHGIDVHTAPDVEEAYAAALLAIADPGS